MCKSFGSIMGSHATISWVIDDLFKRVKLTDSEKLVLLALADSPATMERLTSRYNLDPKRTEAVLQRLSLKGLVYYPKSKSGYVYAVCVPEG